MKVGTQTHKICALILVFILSVVFAILGGMTFEYNCVGVLSASCFFMLSIIHAFVAVLTLDDLATIYERKGGEKNE